MKYLVRCNTEFVQKKKKITKADAAFQFPKTPTGVNGLDEITEGGFPSGRPTIICGSAGCGKTLMSMQFIAKGITDYKEPGVFMSFEESLDDLALNVKSMGIDLHEMIADGNLVVDHVHIDRSEILEAGPYDLEGLFIRLGHAIDKVGAKRVVLDTLESLFAHLNDEAVLRAEMRRLFKWLKSRGVTAVVTAERGEGSLTRHGMEEYVSDCVILLDHRVIDQISTRRLRIVKYRGSTHGTNEYPFLIDDLGISVLPITSLKLDNPVSSEVISTGVPGLDQMFSLQGFYRGGNILISGTAGTAKTTLASYFANEQCNRGEKVIYFAFEESPQQLIRNMRSVGIDLEKHIKDGLLIIQSSRPSLNGLEAHLLTLRKMIVEFSPAAVVIDPISNLINVGSAHDVRAMLVRLIDLLKVTNITALFTSLDRQADQLRPDLSEESISSMVDTWITVRDMEGIGERNRGLYIIKSRGMGHSNQVREFVITGNGIELLDVEIGPEGILTGMARRTNKINNRVSELQLQSDLDRRDREIERKKAVLEANIEALRKEFESAAEELSILKGTQDMRRNIERNEYRTQD